MNDTDTDPPISPLQLGHISKLSADDIRNIDQAILNNASSEYRKQAMVIALALTDLAFPGIPDIYYAQRVSILIQEGKLESRGDVSRMRYSEIRTPIHHK